MELQIQESAERQAVNQTTNDNAASLVNWDADANKAFCQAQAAGNQVEVERTGFRFGAGLLVGAAVGAHAVGEAAVAGAAVGATAGVLGAGALHHAWHHIDPLPPVHQYPPPYEW
jgi:hypothetical protein